MSDQPRTPPGSGRPFDIRVRTLDFADAALDVVAAIPPSPEGGVVRAQLAEAATSIGANVEEADGALTKLDRRKSFVIARKEACESRFWLRLTGRRWGTTIAVAPLLQEVEEIIRVLSAIIDKLS